MLPFTPDELEAAVSNGDVTRRKHPDLDLWIYNYSKQTQYNNNWNKVTENCRGLILDGDYNIVARPWKKFYNLGQVNLPIQFDDPVEVTEKMDGSLGILFYYKNGQDLGERFKGIDFGIATRGSFASEQAIHATAVFQDRYLSKIDRRLILDYTFLFEIVYPENRIVLNYDGLDDLILLGAVDTNRGYYLGPREAAAMLLWPGPVTEVFSHKSISEAIEHMGRPGAEGYVIRSHNFQVKLKEVEYLDLHRLVSNITPKNIWLQLRDGKSVGEICAILPDEFHDYAKSIAEPLMRNYTQRINEIMDGYAKSWRSLNSFQLDRGSYARSIRDNPDKRYYFLLLDDKSIRDVLWSELRPKEADDGTRNLS